LWLLSERHYNKKILNRVILLKLFFITDITMELLPGGVSVIALVGKYKLKWLAWMGLTPAAISEL